MTAPGTSPSGTGRLGTFRRLKEWLWRTEALELARAAQTDASNVAFRRARVAAEVGERILTPASPWLSGSAPHIAASVFVDALGWALRAASATDGGPAEPSVYERGPDRGELERLMHEHAALLQSVAAGAENVERLRSLALERPFEATSYPVSDSEIAARVLADAVERLLRRGLPKQKQTERLLMQRTLRSGAVVLVLLLAASIKPIQRTWLEPRLDLAAGKPWRASSAAETACISPAQHCAAGRDFFFHTTEEQEPWLEIDLTSPQEFSALRVVNRQDCCAERAVPLVVEVSSDHRTWRVVAQQREAFDSWVPRFPGVTARWVRLRVVGRSILHLYEVRVLP